jgi:hypothetical protein
LAGKNFAVPLNFIADEVHRIDKVGFGASVCMLIEHMALSALYLCAFACVNLDCEKTLVFVDDAAFQRTLLGDLREALLEIVFFQQV